MLTAFTLENYRCFADPTTIELRPLTLLFGYNNSGKSTLLRALALIAASARPDARMPLVIDGEEARDGMFDEVRSRLGGSDTIKIGLSFDGGGLTAEYAIAQEPGGIRQVITEMSVTQGETKVALQWIPGPIRESTFALRWNGQPTEMPVRVGFTGLVPDALSILSGGEPPGAADARYIDALAGKLSGDEPPGPEETLYRLVGDLAGHLLELGRRTQWIGSVRKYPERSVRYRGAGVKPIGFDGSHVAERLADDKLVNGPLLAEISGWYDRAFGRKLDAPQAQDGTFSITLESLTSGAGRQINLADTGEGMAQVLPVLVLAAMARRGDRDDPAILALEQPELHLHPAVHAPLAEHLCNLAAKENPPSMLIETHSENFLLGVQIEIAKGDLPPDRVLVYWVRQLDDGASYVQRIEFDDSGFPRGFPEDVFNEDLELARLLLDLRERAGK